MKNTVLTITSLMQWFCLFYQQIVFSSKTPFVARNLLEKLSRQIQVMERLSAVSDENIGSMSSVVEGKRLQITALPCQWRPTSPLLCLPGEHKGVLGPENRAHSVFITSYTPPGRESCIHNLTLGK